MNRKKKKHKLSSVKKKSRKKDIKLPVAIDSEITKALRYHQSGQLQKAEELYKKILHIKPNHPDSLHLLGVIAYQVGKIDIAADLINKAIQNNPKNPAFYNNLGNVIKEQGKLNEAITCYQKALELKPDYAEACNNLGSAFKEQGELNEAITYYQKALELKPDYAEAYNNLGSAFKEQGELDEAISCCQKALKLKPDLPEAYNNMGNAFKDQSKLTDAILCYQKALEIKPGFSEVYNNMGTAFQGQGKSTDAVSCYKKALEIKPDYVSAYYNLGNAFQDKGEFNEAISYYQKALELRPDYAEAYNNIGAMFQEQGKLSEAISCYQKALGLRPDYAEAYNNLFNQFQQTCAWQKIEGMSAKFDVLTREALDSGTKTTETPFINIMRYTDPSRNFTVAKSWSRDVERTTSNLKNHFPHDIRKSRKTKITVGYLSNDFRNHPMAHLMLSLFGLHNRDEFNIFCYSYGKDDVSSYRARIRRDCDKFVDLGNLHYAIAAKCIYEDQVDILVDLKGYTRGNRIGICALRPAPIQVRYLGLAGTTGADFFDYIITDRIVTPEEHAQYYSENFVYMPHCYQVNDHTQEISNKDWKKADFDLPEGSFVYCSFNQGYKIEPVMFNTWMNILRQVPESVLWLQRENEMTERNLGLEAEARGVKFDRLIFAEKLPKYEHLARLRLADAALDTRIVNGAATTSDALWVSVPVITLQGNNFASRMSSGILTGIGLPELIVHSIGEYEALAIRLAHNPGELQTIRQKLTKNLSTEPLFDTPRFTRNLEKAYKEMCKIFMAGGSPRQIEVIET
ncbi:MAG: tetratricopeptide repeat protein [Candidatus Scalinduaceae bacterium]